MGLPSSTSLDTPSLFAGQWLEECGVAESRYPAFRSQPKPGTASLTPAALWAQSGAMALTGHINRPPAGGPRGIAVAAAGFTSALAALNDAFLRLDGPALLGERAACLGLQRAGQTSPGGSGRLLRCADAWIALNLARDDDWRVMNAWLETPVPVSSWALLERQVRSRPALDLIQRGRLLGLAIAYAARPGTFRGTALRTQRLAPAANATSSPLVIDLSSLWAGPLCGHLLTLSGARVVKVESLTRPDGARAGETRFFDILHSRQESVALDFTSPAGQTALHSLIDRADIVLEASRPRALEQLGINARALIAKRPGKIWTSITGYGRTGTEGHWVAFGDDAAVAAGAAWAAAEEAGESEPIFCADAVADPLTGLAAASATLAARKQGGGVLLDISMAGVVNRALRSAVYESDGDLHPAPSPPRARAPSDGAAPLGADTERVLREFVRC